MVCEMIFTSDGKLQSSVLYPAAVRNRAKLAYNSVAAWLDGTGPIPPAIAHVPGLDENLRLQDRVAPRKLKGSAPRGGRTRTRNDSRGARPLFEGRIAQGLDRRDAEPSEGYHRGFHDLGQRRHGPIPRLQARGLPAADRPHAHALGPDHDRSRRRRAALPCRRIPMRRRWMNFSWRRRPPIPSPSPTFR